MHLLEGGDVGPPRIGPNAIGITYVNDEFYFSVIFGLVNRHYFV